MKEIFIERSDKLLRIAVKKNNKLKECFIEEENMEPSPGEIYKGIVKNIVPGIKCAFIDVGYKENCYMYMDRKFKNTNLKKGDEVLVQVVKEKVGKKGPKVTSAISIPGRFCVLNTLDNEMVFSQKINDENVKSNIRNNIMKPEDIGVLIRTKASNVDINIINEEIAELYNTYNDMKSKLAFSSKVGIVYKTGGVFGRIIRDKLDLETTKIYMNSQEDYKEISDYLIKNTDNNTHLEFHSNQRELFDYYGIEKDILKLRNHKVQLNCGGYIIIEKTEAMYVVDVNSGKNIGNASLKKTAFITNLQAAEEVAHQVRLRNLSGIILIDFIDMEDTENKAKVYEKLLKGFEDDKSKTVVYPFTELNLVQIARRRMGKSIYEYIEEECTSCHGKGMRLKRSYIELLIKNEIEKISDQKEIKNIYIEINEIYKNDIKNDILEFIKNIDALDKCIYLNYISGEEFFRVEPLLFINQMENLKLYKVYG